MEHWAQICYLSIDVSNRRGSRYGGGNKLGRKESGSHHDETRPREKAQSVEIIDVSDFVDYADYLVLLIDDLAGCDVQRSSE